MTHPKNQTDANKENIKTGNIIEKPKSSGIMDEIIKGVKKEAFAATKNEGEIKAHPENTKEALDTIEQITEYLKHSKVQEASNFLVEQLDNPSNAKTYAAMNSIRRRWDNQSAAKQKFAVLTLPAFGFLAKTGLLPIKGASRDELRDTGKWIGPALKWGVAAGSMKWPELKELEPYIEPIIQLMNVQSEVYITSYDHLQETRRKRGGMPAVNAPTLGSETTPVKPVEAPLKPKNHPKKRGTYSDFISN